MQYFVYDPLAKMLELSRDGVFREGMQYTAPNAAHKAIMNQHFYRDVIMDPIPIKKQSETSQPFEKHQTK